MQAPDTATLRGNKRAATALQGTRAAPVASLPHGEEVLGEGQQQHPAGAPCPGSEPALGGWRARSTPLPTQARLLGAWGRGSPRLERLLAASSCLRQLPGNEREAFGAEARAPSLFWGLLGWGKLRRERGRRDSSVYRLKKTATDKYLLGRFAQRVNTSLDPARGGAALTKQPINIHNCAHSLSAAGGTGPGLPAPEPARAWQRCQQPRGAAPDKAASVCSGLPTANTARAPSAFISLERRPGNAALAQEPRVGLEPTALQRGRWAPPPASAACAALPRCLGQLVLRGGTSHPCVTLPRPWTLSPPPCRMQQPRCWLGREQGSPDAGDLELPLALLRQRCREL